MIGRIQFVHDRDDPRVAVYRDQKDAWLRARHGPGALPGRGVDAESEGAGSSGTGMEGGLFMAEGVLVVEHLLASPYRVESVLVSERRAEALADLLGRVPPAVPVYAASRAMIESIVGFDVHRGLLACARSGPARDPLELARGCRALVVLEDLCNHDNVGSVFRSVAALGGAGVGVLLSLRCCDPLYRKSLRVSMGHALRVPFATIADWPAGLGAVASLGFSLIGLDPSPHAGPIDAAQAPDRPALVLGAEGPGLSPEVRRLMGRLVRIPMASGVDSLNIGVAAAVALHRLVRPAWAGRDDQNAGDRPCT